MDSEKTTPTNILYLNSLENNDYINNIFLKNEMQKFIDNNNKEIPSHLFEYLLYKQFQTKANSKSTLNNSICIISDNYLNTANIPKLNLKKITLIPYKINSKWALAIFFNLSKCLKDNNKIMTKLLIPFNTNDLLKLKEFLTIISKNLSFDYNDYNLDIEKFILDNNNLSSVFIFNMINELLDKKDFMESFDYINKIYDNGAFNLHLFNEKEKIIEIINDYLKHTTELFEKTMTDNNTIDNDNDEYEDKLTENKINDLAKNTVDDLFNIVYMENNKKKENENLEELAKNTVDGILDFAFNAVKQTENEKNNEEKKKKVDEMAKNTVDEIMDFAFGELTDKEKENEDADKAAKNTVDDIFEFAFNDSLKSKTSDNSSIKDSNNNSDENIKNAVDNILDLAFNEHKTLENNEEEKKDEISLNKNTIDDFLDSVMTDIKKDNEEKNIVNNKNKKEVKKNKDKKKKKKPKRFHLKTKTIDTRIVIIEEAEKESSSGEDNNIIEEITDNGYGYDEIISKKNKENVIEESPLKPKSIESETESELNNLSKTELSEEILYDDNKVLKEKDFIQNENNDINDNNNNVNNDINIKDNDKKFTDNKENININNSNNKKKEIIINDNLNNNILNNNNIELENNKIIFENISKSIEPKDNCRQSKRKLSYNPLNHSVDLNKISKNSLSPKFLRDPLKEISPKVTIYNSVKRIKLPTLSDMLNIEKEPQDCRIPRDNKRNKKIKENSEKCFNKEPNDAIKKSKSSIFDNSTSFTNNINSPKSDISRNSYPLKVIYSSNIEEKSNKVKFKKIFGVDENYTTSLTERSLNEENKKNKVKFSLENIANEINKNNEYKNSNRNNVDYSSNHEKLERVSIGSTKTQKTPTKKSIKYDYYYGYTYSSDFNFNDIENLKEYDMCSIM